MSSNFNDIAAQEAKSNTIENLKAKIADENIEPTVKKLNKAIQKRSKAGYNNITIYFNDDCLTAADIAVKVMGFIVGLLCAWLAFTGIIGAIAGINFREESTVIPWQIIIASILCGLAFMIAFEACKRIWAKRQEDSYIVEHGSVSIDKPTWIQQKVIADYYRSQGYTVKTSNEENPEVYLKYTRIYWISDPDYDAIKTFEDPSMLEAFENGVPADDILA